MNMTVSPAPDDMGYPDPIYMSTVVTADMPNGKTGMGKFGVNAVEARQTARWAWTSITSAVNWAAGVPAKEALFSSQHAVKIPLLRAEDAAGARRTDFRPLTPHAAVIPPDAARKGIDTQALLSVRPGEQHALARSPARKKLLDQFIGLGAAMVLSVEAASAAAKAASIAVGASSLAAGNEMVSKAKDLWRERSEANLEQAGARLAASVIGLHREISHVHKPTDSVVGRAADKVKGLFQPDASSAQQAAAAAAADVVNFWQCCAKVKNPQADSASAVEPSLYAMDWANTLEAPLSKLTCEELSQIRGALHKDEQTAEVLARSVQPREHADWTLMLMKTLANAAAAEARIRYQDKPLAELARIGAARRAMAGDATADADARPFAARPLQDEGVLTKAALENILRGFHEGKSDHPTDTAAQYFARMMSSHGSKMEALRAALDKDNAVNATFDMNAKDPMTAQYRRLFDDLRAIAHGDGANAVRGGPAKNDGAADQDSNVADATPMHRPGLVRRLGRGAAFWGSYLFGSPATQADMRVKYLQARIDVRSGDLQRTLALGTDFDHDKARIESRLRRLHAAVDDLHVELSLQNSSRSADDYLQESLLRSMSTYSPATLKQLRRDLPNDSWQPTAQAAPSTRLRRFAHRIAQAFSNPFHDTMKYEAEMRRRPSLDKRVTSTWVTVQHLIEEEPDVRNLTVELHQLATNLEKRTFEGKDYDAISHAIGDLIRLDAERTIERDVMPAALKRLPAQERGLIVKRLVKYSAQSGEDMIGFVKPERLNKATIADQDKWRYRLELAKLHTAAQSLGIRTEAPSDLHEQAAPSDESRSHDVAAATPVTDGLPAVSSLAVAVSKQPVAWAATRLMAQAARARA